MSPELLNEAFSTKSSGIRIKVHNCVPHVLKYWHHPTLNLEIFVVKIFL